MRVARSQDKNKVIIVQDPGMLWYYSPPCPQEDDRGSSLSGVDMWTVVSLAFLPHPPSPPPVHDWQQLRTRPGQRRVTPLRISSSLLSTLLTCLPGCLHSVASARHWHNWVDATERGWLNPRQTCWPHLRPFHLFAGDEVP